MILTLVSSFSSAHFYSQPQWDEKKNLATFGRCYTRYGHGHNYKLEVGFRVAAAELSDKKESYQELLYRLTSILDHEHLNFVIPEFKEQIPTTENIALYFLNKLKLHVSEKDLSYLRLYEMDNLWTEIRL
ncbi:6-carboxytetrahydropterin synthase [Bdellovibrio bacteriovorus]|uniref:6-carboxytetrahydropterin synthase n=1 Tax=Bdellovibrio bacteriovorus TaxID=959 RepID=UPI0035A6B1EE